MNKMIINRKQIKRESRKNLKATYLKSILVIFIFTLFMTGTYTYKTYIDKTNPLTRTPDTVKKISNFNIIDDLAHEIIKSKGKDQNIDKKKEAKAKGVLAPIINKVTEEKSAFVSFVSTFNLFFYKHNINAGILSLIASIILLLIYIFIKLVLDVGKNRYYLEARRYRETKIEKMLFPYRTLKTVHIAIIIFTKNIYQILWTLTIIGGPIKYYEYLMIPYVIAENPNITRKEAFSLSKEMMQGLKWQTFKLDLTLIGWDFLAILTFGFSNIFYADAYREFIHAELYTNIKQNKKSKLTYGNLLNDTYLDIKTPINKEYPIDKYQIPLWYKKDFKSDYNQNYSIITYILFFFTFAFIGWCWEVLLSFVTDGTFVNRGTMLGPWLPIYGVGALIILIILKPFRTRPVIYFLISMVLAGVLEFSTSWYLETFKGMKWWDYSGYFLNIDGRICLEGLIIFGLGGAVVTYFIAPLLSYYYNKIKPKIIIPISVGLISLFTIDLVYSFEHPNSGEGITDYQTNTINHLIWYITS